MVSSGRELWLGQGQPGDSNINVTRVGDAGCDEDGMEQKEKESDTYSLDVGLSPMNEELT